MKVLFDVSERERTVAKNRFRSTQPQSSSKSANVPHTCTMVQCIPHTRTELAT